MCRLCNNWIAQTKFLKFVDNDNKCEIGIVSYDKHPPFVPQLYINIEESTCSTHIRYCPFCGKKLF